MRVSIVLLIAVILATSATAASASVKFTRIGEWGGEDKLVAVSGHIACIAAADYIAVEDISDPASPVKLGSIVIGEMPTAMALSGNILCVSPVGFSQLQVIDISDPTHPAKIGACPACSYVNHIAISGNRAYLQDDYYGLTIVDISDPTHPTQIGSYSDYAYTNGFAVSGNYVYFTKYSPPDNWDLVALDVSNPAAPSVASTYPGQYAFHAAVAGNRLYLAGYNMLGLQEFDISDPAHPAYVGDYDLPETDPYLSYWTVKALAASEDTVMLVDDNGQTMLFGVSASGELSLKKTVDDLRLNDLSISGDHAYAACGWLGFEVFDVSDPANPAKVGIDPSGYIDSIAVSGTKAYCTTVETDRPFYTYWNLASFDIANPKSWKLLAKLDIDGSGPIKVYGDYAYMRGGYSGLTVADISNAASPFVLGSFDVPYSILGFFDHYMVSGSPLRVVDISNPSAPFVVQGSEIQTAGNAGACVSGSYLYVGEQGLRVYDISTPSAPVLVGSYVATGTDYPALVASGNYVYAGVSTVFDVSDPTNPMLVGGWTDWGAIGYYPGLTLSGDYLYMTNQWSWQALDVSSPSNPVPAGSYNGGEILAADGNTLYVTSNYGALVAVQAEHSDLCIIYGSVKDSAGNPLSGITVTAEPGGRTATTDYLGHYILEDVPDGLCNLAVSPDGWPSASTSINAPKGATVKASDLVLQLGSISGCVRDDLGNPVAGVSISAGWSVPSVETDVNGNYALPNLRPPAYSVSASKEHYLPSTIDVSVTQGQSVVVDFTLPRLATIAGRITDSLGRPVVGVQVTLGSNTDYSRGDGSYSFSDMHSGVYKFTMSLKGVSFVDNPQLEVQPGAALTLDYTVQLSTVSGQVRGPNGAPMAGSRVLVCPGDCTYETMTDSSGSYALSSILPGEYTVYSGASGYAEMQRNLTLHEGEAAVCSFVLADQAGLTTVGRLNTGDSLCGIALQANMAYLTDPGSGLHMVDISEPTHPVEVGFYPALDAFGVAVSGHFAYLVCQWSGIRIIDISDPANPALSGACATDDAALSVAVSQTHMYVAACWGGLQIYDVSDPANPVEVGRYEAGGCANRVAVAGSYAYVAARWEGLKIIDISDASHPTCVGTFTTNGIDARDVKVVGSLAYVADSQHGLQLVDVSDPTHPSLAGKYSTVGEPTALAVSGRYAYLANTVRPMSVVDIFDPAQMGTADYDYSLYAVDIAASGDYIYAVSGNLMKVMTVGRIRVDSIYPGWVADRSTQAFTVHGAAFTEGMTVKLTRPGQPDIVATDVSTTNPSMVACRFDLSGAVLGFWNIVVTKSNGESGHNGGLQIVLPYGTPTVGASVSCISDPIMSTASNSRRFRFWGSVISIEGSTFVIDGGTARPLTIYAPGWSGFYVGSYVAVTGTFDSSCNTLISTLDQITVYPDGYLNGLTSINSKDTADLR